MGKRIASFAAAGALLPFSVWMIACSLDNLRATPVVAFVQFVAGLTAADITRELLAIARGHA